MSMIDEPTFTAEQVAQAQDYYRAVISVAAIGQQHEVDPSLLLGAIGAACLEIFKAHQPHHLLPDLLRAEAARVERMIGLDTASPTYAAR